MTDQDTERSLGRIEATLEALLRELTALRVDTQTALQAHATHDDERFDALGTRMSAAEDRLATYKGGLRLLAVFGGALSLAQLWELLRSAFHG